MITVSLATGRPVATGPEEELPGFRALVLERREVFAALPVDAALVVTPGLPLARGVCSSCGSREHISPLRGGDCAACGVARFLAIEAMTVETLRSRAAARTRELNVVVVVSEAEAAPGEIAPIASEPAAAQAPAEITPAPAPLAPATAAPRPIASPKSRKAKPERAAGSLF